MPDKALNILVRILTEKVGEQDATAILDEYKQAAGKAGVSTDDLGRAMRKGGEAAEHAGISHRELRRVLLDVGNVAAPGAGRALAELALGPVGAALALVEAYRVLQEHIKKVEEEADTLNQQELDNHRQAVENLFQRYEDAKQSFLRYTLAVEEASKVKDPQGEELKRIEAVSAARTAANIKELEELGKREVAYKRAHPELFTAADVEAAERRTQKAVEQTKDTGEKQTTAEIEADIKKRQENQHKLDDAQTAADKRVEDAQNAVDRADQAKKDATPDAKKLIEQNKQIEKLQSDIAYQKDVVKYETPGTAGEQGAKLHLAELQKQLDDLIAEQKRQADAAAAAKKALDAAGTEKTKAEEAQKHAAAEGTANQETITKEQEDVKTRKAVETEKEKGQQTGDAAELFGEGKALADFAHKGGKLTDAQAQFLITLEQTVTGHQQTLQSAIDNMEAQSRNEEFMLKLLQNATGRINTMAQRLHDLEAQSGNRRL